MEESHGVSIGTFSESGFPGRFPLLFLCWPESILFTFSLLRSLVSTEERFLDLGSGAVSLCVEVAGFVLAFFLPLSSVSPLQLLWAKFTEMRR